MQKIIMKESFQNIYKRMGDAQSRRIYSERLNYSITSDRGILEKMIDEVVRSRREWQFFLKLLQRKALSASMYIFGAGIWGNILFRETENLIAWQGVIDNQPDGKNIAGLTIMTLEEFLKSSNEKAVIVISSYKNEHSMLSQLKEAGISSDKIVNGGHNLQFDRRSDLF